ncbi:MAG: Gfo/Idh/MocA family oxidoreductase [Chloroflexi bacterium]|nr:Gfo/Idh/MocA family oxidoreductase [Chloroflexota bacterium]
MTSTPSVRIAVIGVGFGTQVHIPGLQSEGLEVVAVCARRPERANEAAQKFGVARAVTDYRLVLDMGDIDAVSIVTPHYLHREMAIAALAAGKHVLCEKPTAVNTAEARAMRDAARASDRTVMIAHEFRWAPQRAYVKRLLDDGYIGGFRSAHASLWVGPRRPASRPRPSAEPDLGVRGGFLWGLGSHYLDAFRHWFGDVISVQAMLRAAVPERIHPTTGEPSTTDTDDTFSLILEFANGGWATLSGSSAAPFGQGAMIEVFGTEGSLSTPQPAPGFNPPPDGRVYGARFGDDDRHELPTPSEYLPFVDDRDHRLVAFRLMVREFVRGIREGVSPAPNFEDAYRIQQVLDAAVESSSSGARVAIPLD